MPVKKSDWKITASKNNSGIKILIQPPDGKTPVNKIEFFPYEGGVYNNAASQNFTKTGGGYSLQIPYDDFRVKEPDNLKGILVSDYGWTGKISRKALEVIISFNK